MSKIVELNHTSVAEGKEKAKTVTTLSIPSFRPELRGRWRAVYTKEYNPDTDMEWLVKEILKIVPSLSDITTQRAIYYMLRGQYPDRLFRGNPLGSDKFYTQLTSTGMEKVQLASGVTMQSLGIWAAPRGYIAGDGKIRTTRRGNIPLTAQPTLQFDLVDVGSSLDSRARKVIHFEKDAGFAALVGGDMPKFIEAIFSTSQGQLSESANKFLHEAEEWGLQCYCVHDADTFGLQMQLLYGLASKNNCYMPSEFYPNSVKSLGFFPSIAKYLKLPPETIDEKDKILFPNLRQMVEEHPELKDEVEILTRTMNKWEFQALNAISEHAPQIYLIEGLRASGDEIKYIPDGTELKDIILERFDAQKETAIEDAINSATDEALRLIRDDVYAKIKEVLNTEAAIFDEKVQDVRASIESTSDNAFREAVKRELVSDPSLYWDTALARVAKDTFKLEFVAEAKADAIVKISDIKATTEAEATPPNMPDTPLSKDDIVEAIESKIIRAEKKRMSLREPIRKAFEQVFGEPNQEW